ncbi:MAG TPA: hypothetical protein VKT51_11290 [Candidatus Eremiobacteraceae bacterium]|nr:hypothetical protein [Candidatus Eremiobacteraceae bacterium]
MRVPNVRQLGVASALCLGSFALGSALHLPAMATQVYEQYLSPNTACNSSSPCTSTTNNGSGPASANTSVGGTALTGTTKFNGTSKTKFAAGVLGTDSSTKGKFDIGVEGTSVSGDGVQGTSKSGIGVNGVANSGFGVSGTSSNVGVLGNGSTAGVEGRGNAAGVLAIANDSAGNGTGLVAVANGADGVGVAAIGASFGLQASGPTAIQAIGNNNAADTAVEAVSSGSAFYTGFSGGKLTFIVDGSGNVETEGFVSGTAASFDNACCDPALDVVSPQYALFATTTNSSSTNAVINAFTAGGPLFLGVNRSADTFIVDAAGNVTIAGKIFTAGMCSSGCIAHGPRQQRVISYAPRESQPTIEDFGEGQLVNGEARIALDSAFANVIDKSANYLVFAMPEGDCNGLYIAAKSSMGFEVRELRGGHSTLGFEYRIIAKPFGDHSARLPTVVMPAPPPHPEMRRMPNLKPPQRGIHK